MQENAVQNSWKDERAELDAVVEALTRSPRLAKLLCYMGEKYFSGERDQLTEYNIATEVFDRSKTVFDSTEDAIARVEAHRLRKRLKQFYENEGQNHPIQIVLPVGSYAPVFRKTAVEVPGGVSAMPAGGNVEAVSAGVPEQQKEPEEVEPWALARRVLWQRRNWIVAATIAFVLAIAITTLWQRQNSIALRKARETEAAAVGNAALRARGPADAVNVPLRIIAGYSGPVQTDSAAETWQADEYFHGGGSWRRGDSPISRTSDPLLFKQWRTGNFSYDIPLAPGVYELHLYFVSSASPEDSMSTFTVWINGERALTSFDINADALGKDIADERIFRDISPASDGMLHLSFSSERAAPALNAIEVLPGIPHRQLPIRIATLSTAFRDHNGNVWHPDTYYMNGRMRTESTAITGTEDPDLFGSERYGHFTYAIPVDPRDRYTVVLHFAELYFGPQSAGLGGVGSRIFRVICNGDTLLDNFDIYKEAGSLRALVKTFHHLKPTAQGKLDLTFEPIRNNATISAIEVLDESE